MYQKFVKNKNIHNIRNRTSETKSERKRIQTTTNKEIKSKLT